MSRPEPQSGERLRRQFCFADFTLDLDYGVLRREGEEVTLRPKSFEVLSYLVEHHGQLVTKAELMDSVWRDTAVTDNSLAQCMVEIRRVLADESQQLIRTVARRGYLFAAPVTTPVVEFPRQSVPLVQTGPVQPPPDRGPLNRSRNRLIAGALMLLAVGVAGLILLRPARNAKQNVAYTQITHFTDSAVSPALSPDGRMLAFIRSQSWFQTSGQIYVKLLPDGDPVQITNDSRPKYGLAFSPDGSRIAYAAVHSAEWITYTISPLGGAPAKLLPNAAGLTWLDEHHVLFSEIKSGLHMGMVTAKENRSEYRRIYFPRDERGMVHLSYASPDRKWALAVEMNPVWQPCRVIPMDGSSQGRQAGPKGRCTSAAWSPDGKWMYLSVDVGGRRHLWRQRFPEGAPEQITSGTTEEEGIAVAPDGRSLITSVGMRQGELWIHDAHGERQLSSEGHVAASDETGRFASMPMFSPDGKSLFYLRRQSPEAATDLWRVDLESERSEKVLSGFPMLEYDVSNDSQEVVFSTQASADRVQIWLGALGGRTPPQPIPVFGGDSPHFGPNGEILFRLSEDGKHYLARMNRDGSGRSRVAPYPIGNVEYISPDRRWITTISPSPNGGLWSTLAVPTAGGAPRVIYAGRGMPVRWAPDGKFLYVSMAEEKTLAIPISAGETLPDLPPSGIREPKTLAVLPGAQIVDRSSISPGPNPSVFAYVKTTVHRNLFRVPSPD